MRLPLTPPPPPPIKLPFAARLVPGVKQTITEAFRSAYYLGVFDGVVAVTLVFLLLLILSTIRRRVAKGVSRVTSEK